MSAASRAPALMRHARTVLGVVSGCVCVRAQTIELPDTRTTLVAFAGGLFVLVLVVVSVAGTSPLTDALMADACDSIRRIANTQPIVSLAAPLRAHVDAFFVSRAQRGAALGRRAAAQAPRGLWRTERAPPPALAPDAASAALDVYPTRTLPYYAGLYNPNVYCFFNSVVQALGSVTRLAAYLDRVTDMAERWDVPTPVTDALRALLVSLNTPQARGGALMPKQLTSALGSVSQMNGLRTLMAAHQQQDAHELAVLLLGAIDAELAAVQHERYTQLRTRAAGLAALTAPSTIVHGHRRLQLGWGGDDVSNPFRGTLAQRTSCAQCQYTETVRHFSFTDVSLVVPGVAACTLEQCFSAWAQLEHIEWVCHRCSLVATLRRLQAEQMSHEALAEGAAPRRKARALESAAAAATAEAVQRVATALRQGMHETELEDTGLLDGIALERVLSTAATKQVLIAQPPPVLLVHLNRSSFTFGSFGASKNNARVVFDEWLDVAPFATSGALSMDALQPLSPAPQRSPTTRYRLSAVVTHYGTHSYGHYVCFRRRPVGWTVSSDASVRPCELDDVLAQNPYLLVYERAEAGVEARRAPRARIVARWAGNERHTQAPPATL